MVAVNGGPDNRRVGAAARAVRVEKISGRRDMTNFIYLPEIINRDRRLWVPPVYSDERRFFGPGKNPAASYCDTTLALAYRNGRPAGRIMGIINRRYNDARDERTARFGCLECSEDKSVAHALLAFVEDWARRAGMNKVVGPMGFTDQDAEGFLVEGFEYEPTIGTYFNPEYIIGFVEGAGYSKEIDYVVYQVPIPKEVPAFYRRIAARVSARTEIELREFERRRELKPYIVPILGLMNETFRHLYGYTVLDDEEMMSLAKQYLPVIDPRFVKAVAVGGRVVAFALGIPHWVGGLRKARGRLFPFGWVEIMRAAKKTKQLDMLLGAISPEFRGKGVDALLGAAIIRSARAAGFDIMDSHQELETNVRVRAEMERLGGKVYKRYRVFQKRI